jgi:cobyric acid synthase
MTGYQELLTDPSYRGQMVSMTYPLIGNYGVNLEDMESDHNKDAVVNDSRNRVPCINEGGCVDDSGRIMGTYLHGVFDTPAILGGWLDNIGLSHITI